MLAEYSHTSWIQTAWRGEGEAAGITRSEENQTVANKRKAKTKRRTIRNTNGLASVTKVILIKAVFVNKREKMPAAQKEATRAAKRYC